MDECGLERLLDKNHITNISYLSNSKINSNNPKYIYMDLHVYIDEDTIIKDKKKKR